MPTYRPDIDGLRAIAVIAVILFHAFPDVLPGGFIGVDVFFVISGYLITGIIARELHDGSFRAGLFYRRRIRRLFPALATVLLATLAYGMVVLLPSERAQLGEQIAAGAAMAANLLFWHQAGYFDPASYAKPLLHLWSLGVEEQFYLVWPGLLWLLVRRTHRPVAGIALLTAASFALNLMLSTGQGVADFYSPLSRLWELSAGALVAVAGPGRLRAQAGPAAIAGLIAVVAATMLFDEAMPYPGWRALVPVFGTLLLIHCGPATMVGRLLAGRVPVAVGRISYPLYLWHWPLLSFATIIRRGHAPKPLLAALLVAAAFGLATLTWRFVERPLRHDPRLGRVTVRLATALAGLGLAGAALAAAQGLPSAATRQAGLNIAKLDAAGRDPIFRPTRDMRVRMVQGLTLASIGQGGRAVLFTGDSLLFQYGPLVQRLFETGRLRARVYFLAGPSCAPIPGATRPDRFATCSAMPHLAEALIAREHVGTVVLGAFWAMNRGRDAFVTRGGRRRALDTADAQTDVYANLEDWVRSLVAAGVRVELVLATPADARFDPALVLDRSWHGYSLDAGRLQGVASEELRLASEPTDRRLRAIAGRTGAGTLDPFTDICGRGPVCPFLFADGQPVFSDGLHLRPSFVADRIHVFDGLLTQ